MWSAIRGLISLLAAVAVAVFTYLTYVNTLQEQARRKAATVEVSTTDSGPATATVTVTAGRLPAREDAPPVRRVAPPRPQAVEAERPSASPLFRQLWHLPLSNRYVRLQPIAATEGTFVVRDVTGPVEQPIGFGTVRGDDVRIQLRVTKPVGDGSYVTRDATLRLTLSSDGGELAGDFRGEAAVERGPVLWLASTAMMQTSVRGE
ncbi:MAG TPA: hypothetical protein VFN10_19350 [Thermoanaerobaculia bacterium]|nr:hypothetical protein [Thermoanaerobaculia bacterium]